MGVDLVVYIRRDQVGKLIDIDSNYPLWDDFYALAKMPIRWGVFAEWLHLETDEPITSKELLKHLAMLNRKVENRELLVRLCSKYELLFAPDTAKVDKKKWVDIFEVESAVQKVVKENFGKILSLIDRKSDS